MSKLPKAALRRRGQLAWHATLVRQGRHEEAQLWAERHRLHAVPPKWPGLTLAKQTVPSADPAASSAVGGIGAANYSPSNCIASTGPSLLQSNCLATGGAGVPSSTGRPNLDRTARGVENPQLSSPSSAGVSGLASPSLGVGSAADAAFLASPSGEVEGNRQSSQANDGSRDSNRLESSGGWVVSGEGVVGGPCMNKWFVEVSVGGRWAKAQVGGRMLRRNMRVRVRLEWVSADGRDAEYEVVEVLPDVEGPKQAPPIGFKAQGNEGTYHAVNSLPKAAESAAKPNSGVFQTLPPQSMGFQQLPVPVVHDQPKEVVFQTTTMERLVEAENVGTMHASGKTGPVALAEEFRSPVLEDVPAAPPEPGLGPDDFMARARAAVMAELMSRPGAFPG